MRIYCRQFVSMHRAGVTILESMRMLTEQTENPTLKDGLQEVYLGVLKGESLASSMAKRPDVFPKLLIHMGSAGEASGSLDIAIERMAVQFEKSAKIQGLIKKTMIYPIMVLVVAVVVVIVMLTFVVPTFMSMFADMDIDMPKITLAVVAASEFMQARWYIVVAVIIAIVFFIRWFKRTETGETLFAEIRRNSGHDCFFHLFDIVVHDNINRFLEVDFMDRDFFGFLTDKGKDQYHRVGSRNF